MPGIYFYTICVAFASGIFFRSFFNVGLEVTSLCFVVSFACALLWRRKANGFSSSLFLASLFLFGFALGMFRMDIADTSVSQLSEYEGKTIEVLGMIVREPETRAQTIHLHVEPFVNDEYLSERVLITVDRFAYAEHAFEYGNIIRVIGALQKPKAFETDTGRIFDYQKYLRTQNVMYTIPRADVSLEASGSNSLFRVLFAGKQKFITSLESVLSHPYSSLGEGVLLGVKRALGETLDEVFRKTGIIHIVVLSGYNILIVVEAMMFILAYFCRPRMRMVIGLLWVVSFAFLVGMSATVVRASIMAGLLLIARGTGRVYAVLRGLGIAGVVMLCINPYLLAFDPGFQLSFLATLGLILFSPYIERHINFIPSFVGIRGIVTATLSTQLAVLPLLLYLTGTLSVVSVLVNVLVLPMVPVAMFLTFLTGVIATASVPIATVIGFVAYLSLAYIIEVATWFAGLSFAATSVNAFPFWIVVVCYIILGLFYVTRMQNVSQKNVLVEAHVVTNDYDGWVIEEETETPPETQSVSGGDKDSLPFR